MKSGLISYSVGASVAAVGVQARAEPITPPSAVPVLEQLSPHQQQLVEGLMRLPLVELNGLTVVGADVVALVGVAGVVFRACLDWMNRKKGGQ